MDWIGRNTHIGLDNTLNGFHLAIDQAAHRLAYGARTVAGLWFGAWHRDAKGIS